MATGIIHEQCGCQPICWDSASIMQVQDQTLYASRERREDIIES